MEKKKKISIKMISMVWCGANSSPTLGANT